MELDLRFFFYEMAGIFVPGALLVALGALASISLDLGEPRVIDVVLSWEPMLIALGVLVLSYLLGHLVQSLGPVMLFLMERRVPSRNDPQRGDDHTSERNDPGPAHFIPEVEDALRARIHEHFGLEERAKHEPANEDTVVAADPREKGTTPDRMTGEPLLQGSRTYPPDVLELCYAEVLSDDRGPRIRALEGVVDFYKALLPAAGVTLMLAPVVLAARFFAWLLAGASMAPPSGLTASWVVAGILGVWILFHANSMHAKARTDFERGVYLTFYALTAGVRTTDEDQAPGSEAARPRSRILS